jgi:hypothetical protein
MGLLNTPPPGRARAEGEEMSDNGAPYDKAIEETAKATSNAVDLIREGGRAISPAIGNVYGLLIGDKVAAARERRLDEITRKTRKILHDRGVKEQQELPEDIAIPLLEAAQSEPREELQEVWARLLANAMDPARAGNIRPEFIETVRQLQPIDVKILITTHHHLRNTKQAVKETEAVERAKVRDTAARVSIQHLYKLGCIVRVGGGQFLGLSDYAHELMIAVAP